LALTLSVISATSTVVPTSRVHRVMTKDPMPVCSDDGFEMSKVFCHEKRWLGTKVALCLVVTTNYAAAYIRTPTLN